MSILPSQAIIRGIPNHPEVNVRAGPGTGYELVFKLPVEQVVAIVDALPDATENHFQGKIYQWLKLRLPDGRGGWVRDDLLDLAPGDHSLLGYPVLNIRTYAFTLSRDMSKRPPAFAFIAPDPAASAEEDAEEAPTPAEEPPLWIPAEEEEPANTPATDEEPPLWIPAEEDSPAVTPPMVTPAPVETPPTEESPGPDTSADEAPAPLWIPADEAPAPESAASEPETDPAADETPESVENGLDTPIPAEQSCRAIVIGARTGINVRSGPSTAYAVVTRLDRGTQLPILEVRPQDNGGPFKWVQVEVDGGKEGWIREDLLSFRGVDCVTSGLLKAADLYPAPMTIPNYWWVRGYVGPLPDHNGWDLGADTGEPVMAGPRGGTVIISFGATRATPDKPSITDHGWQLGDPRVFSDPGWGFGYGHYIVVRYLNHQLPPYTQDALADRGMPGAAAYVMYAHLHSRAAFQGQELAPGALIGTCGNTGNSQATHLHLEVRASTNPSETSWGRLGRGLVPPGILFNV